MSVPAIQFPVAFEDIPAEVKRLTTFMRGLNADLALAQRQLSLIREGCEHKEAERGCNDRDGSWMNTCPHCGATE